MSIFNKKSKKNTKLSYQDLTPKQKKIYLILAKNKSIKGYDRTNKVLLGLNIATAIKSHGDAIRVTNTASKLGNLGASALSVSMAIKCHYDNKDIKRAKLAYTNDLNKINL